MKRNTFKSFEKGISRRENLLREFFKGILSQIPKFKTHFGSLVNPNSIST